MVSKPRAIDLFCGLGGWTDGLLAEGYEVTGYDIEEHVYGDMRYPAELVLQDVRTLRGAQFKDAALIVASPPCQEYSYMAMPWSKAKAKAAAIRADETGEKLAALNDLFNQCFRIQKEASIAAGRHIPLVVENVRGAIPWVGRSRWNFGSFHLWGDVPALMPVTMRAQKVPGFRFDGSGKSFQTASVQEHIKNNGGSWFAIGSSGQKVTGKNPVHELATGVKGFVPEGTKALGKHGHPRILPQIVNTTGSGSTARKMASAMIAKIPLPLSRHIGASYRP